MYKKSILPLLKKWFSNRRVWKRAGLLAIMAFLIASGLIILWIATLRIPDLQSFQDKVLAGSTKIYDRTGNILLYDVNQNAKQQVVPFNQISKNIVNATIAIEDENFYTHSGIAFTSILRAIIVDIQTMRFSQGGSTITQQVIKNSLLTTDKRISRKIKEWVLSLKLEKVMPKDEILNLYLNGTTYGSNYYGVEEASQNYFGKKAADVGIAEAAYLAALPQAPSRYSPYGNHLDLLEARKNLVLQKMKQNGLITNAQYNAARSEKVTFKPQENHSIKSPHFVMYIKEYLEEKYGEDMVKSGNLKVVTTLDYEMQKKAEVTVKKYALKNVDNFGAENAGMVAIDPTTGQVLVMVGSRDYFDDKIQGNYNIALAQRQPGSAFKPFAYATAFNKGYTPETVLFDVPTQFSTSCDANGNPLRASADCYMPENYDKNFRGPISIRNALAQSINIPAVKTLYLVGIKDTINTAKQMGITSLTNSDQYGLTLVLGGGEVSPIEITSAYGVFANNGLRNNHTSILKITDKNGNVLEEYKPDATQVLPEQTALLINNILHDNAARLPLNGPGSPTDFPNREVALKTGTTNDSRDAWIIGYTPYIVVGAWAGNNNNTPMKKKPGATSGLIIAPMWRDFMDQILPDFPDETFKRPEPADMNLKPILRGEYMVNTGFGVEIHNILHWVNRADPTGPAPSSPASDSQYDLWEQPVRAWVFTHNVGIINPGTTSPIIPNPITPNPQPTTDTGATPRVTIQTPPNGQVFSKTDNITVNISYQSKYQLVRAEYFVNGVLVNTNNTFPFTYSFIPNKALPIPAINTLKVVVYDFYSNRGETQITFQVR